MKTIQVPASEVEAKQAEISAKVAAYQAAQANQLANGGPGPVAEHDIMVIVNEHSAEFEVTAKPEEVVEEIIEAPLE
jgi:hypothetical protein